MKNKKRFFYHRLLFYILGLLIMSVGSNLFLKAALGCVLFQITELGREEIPLSIRDINVYQTSLFQQNDERRVYMAFLAVFTDNN